MIAVKGGVTVPRAFLASGVRSGIKASGKMDLGLIFSEVPAVAAGAFTSSRFQASPVKLCIKNLKGRLHQAIVVNSGNANCANGRIGYSDAVEMVDTASKYLGLSPKSVLVASTGIIGQRLPLNKIKAAVPSLVGSLSAEGGACFADSLMTTDTIRKEYVVKTRIGSRVITIGGACKGVGMLHPELKVAKHATMLAFLTTDASISKRMLEASLGEAVKDSFNMVSVDGDMSTNDTCIVLANGTAGNKRIVKKDGAYRKFTEALKFISCQLAKMLARDGEGATKFIEIEVRGAKTADDARLAARKISASNLLKCAVYGEDPNWGRICAAAGSSGAEFDCEKMDVYLGPVKALSKGIIAKGFNKEKARRCFKGGDVNITVDLKAGKHRATAWTCDLSKEYIAINSEYST